MPEIKNAIELHNCSMPEIKNAIELHNCSLEPDGTVTCKVPETTLDYVQKFHIRPKRLVLEIEV